MSGKEVGVEGVVLIVGLFVFLVFGVFAFSVYSVADRVACVQPHAVVSEVQND
jgi:hypothetical protein